MGVKNLFTWYQKKIGTYDKQKWETTVENKILYGLTHIQMKSTTPNTDFIDLDLVRGSPIEKVKSKQGVFTIVKLATLRCIFLPLYSKWWMQQTSLAIFLVLFCVYLSLLVNIAIYVNTVLHNENADKKETIIFMELVIPFMMSWVLSYVHSQIFATMSTPDSQKTKLAKKSFRRRIRQVDATPLTKPLLSSENGGTSTKKKVVDLGVKNVRFNMAKRKPQADDDGFESLNGNGSRTSEEETLPGHVKNVLLAQKRRCDDWVKNQTIAKRNEGDNSDAEVESDEVESEPQPKAVNTFRAKRTKYRIPRIDVTSVDSTCDTDDECVDDKSIKADLSSSNHEWMNVTTNSEDCSYSSDMDEVSDVRGAHIESNEDYDHDLGPTGVHNAPSIKVSCMVWKRGEIKKAELTMLDISSAIIGKVESPSQNMDYLYVGIIISTIHALIPILFRLFHNATFETEIETHFPLFDLINNMFINQLPTTMVTFINSAFGTTIWERIIVLTACLQRWFLANLLFFLLAVAENTFKQRFLYSKLFSHLTSFRRAQQSELPHFRLNKVRNIKTWLSVRSYLKQRGPQRSVDVIVSTAFIITLLLLSFLCIELLKETGALNTQYHVEALILCIGVGILLLQFMTLGNKINKKYRNLSVLITEQINLHLQIEQKPQKKDELALANNVLKLAIDLIKELQSPFKISGLSANSILYNTTKLIILSALSGVLSELLGFKLKLHKLKIK